MMTKKIISILFAIILVLGTGVTAFAEERHVFDLEIEDNHNYIANNLIVHNCIGKKEKELLNGKRVLIIDDVISTGESLHALEELVEKAGGNIVGKMAVLAEGEAAERKDIIFLEPLPLFDAEGNPLK